MGILSALSPLVGAGAGFLMGGPVGMAIGGGLGATVGGALGQGEANDANAQQAQLNRDFQERMSSTSYQRGVKDMEAAGLNPMLAYSQGGASTPGGSVASPMLNKMGAGISSASQAVGSVSAAAQISQIKAQTDLISAQADKARSETLDQSLNSALVAAQVKAALGAGESSSSQAKVNLERILTERYGAMDAQMRYRAMMSKPGDTDVTGTGFEALVRSLKAGASASELGLGKARAESDFWKSELGGANPYIRALLPVFSLIKGL